MNKPTIIRKIDDLGRIVLPIDVRKRLNIMPGDTLEMIVSNDNIQIKKTTSIYNLSWLAKIMIKSLYEIYHIESALTDGTTFLASIKKNKQKEFQFPLKIANKEVGYYVVYDYLEQDKKIVDFVLLFFQKYLEEQ